MKQSCFTWLCTCAPMCSEGSWRYWQPFEEMEQFTWIYYFTRELFKKIKTCLDRLEVNFQPFPRSRDGLCCLLVNEVF